jgi:hypothetical protein
VSSIPEEGGFGFCPVWRFDAPGGPDQEPTLVGKVPALCNPSGLTFRRLGSLYVTGSGVGGDEIAVLTPDSKNPPTATVFATGTPGANGLAFDGAGNLYASDGGTNQGRVFRGTSWPTASCSRTTVRCSLPTRPAARSGASTALCTTQLDGNRRDNSPNTAGDVRGTGMISCLDERLQMPRLPVGSRE